MNKKQALKELEAMNDKDFNEFLNSLPPRVT